VTESSWFQGLSTSLITQRQRHGWFDRSSALRRHGRTCPAADVTAIELRSATSDHPRRIPTTIPVGLQTVRCWPNRPSAGTFTTLLEQIYMRSLSVHSKDCGRCPTGYIIALNLYDGNAFSTKLPALMLMTLKLFNRISHARRFRC